MVEGTHHAVAGIVQVTGRWVTEPMVVGYGSFSDNVRYISRGVFQQDIFTEKKQSECYENSNENSIVEINFQLILQGKVKLITPLIN